MVNAFVLINVERPMMKSVIDQVMEIEGVTEVYTVAGEYDLLAVVRVQNNKVLSDIVADKMPHDVKGITHTKTLISLKAFSEYNLEEIFDVT